MAEEEPAVDALLERPECAWIDGDLEQKAQAYAVAHVVPEHLREVRDARLALIAKTEAAVKDRLTKEIAFWDHRAEQLKLDEEAGQVRRPTQLGRGTPAGGHFADSGCRSGWRN